MPNEKLGLAAAPGQGYDPEIDTKIEKVSFMSGLMNFGNLIVKSNLDLTSTTTLYTVPEGKRFFLIYAFSSVRSAGTNTGSGGLYVDDNTKNILIWDIVDLKNYNSQSISFTIPIILNPNQKIINMALGSGNRVYSGVWGYEVEKTLIPNFFN